LTFWYVIAFRESSRKQAVVIRTTSERIFNELQEKLKDVEPITFCIDGIDVSFWNGNALHFNGRSFLRHLKEVK